MREHFAILDDLNEPLALINKDLQILYVNKFFYTFSKTTPRIINSSPKLDSIISQGAFNLKQSVAEVLETKEVVRSSEIEIHAPKSNKTYNGIIKLIPITNEDSPLLLWSFFDFTNELELQNKYKNQLSELSENHSLIMRGNKLKAIGEVYESISHEINNPLTSSSFFLDKLETLLKDNKPDIKEASKLVGQINFQIKTVSEIVLNMRRYLTQDSSKKEYINIIDLIYKSRDLAKTLHIFADLNFTLRLSPTPAFVWANEIELTQVFINLFKNAAQALKKTNSPEKEIEITFKEDCQEQQYVIEVSDNGPGIVEDLKENLFEAFTTSKDPEEGTGLGLSIVKKIIDEHHAQITVDSTPEEKTTFTISFPTIELASFVNNKLFNKTGNDIKQIVLILNNSSLINSLNEKLTNKGFAVMIGSRIDSTQEIYTDFIPNLVVTDNQQINPIDARANLLQINKEDSLDQIITNIENKL